MKVDYGFPSSKLRAKKNEGKAIFIVILMGVVMLALWMI